MAGSDIEKFNRTAKGCGFGYNQTVVLGDVTYPKALDLNDRALCVKKFNTTN